MSLLDSHDLIEIKLYYKYITTSNGKKVIILEDKKAEELLKDEEKAKEVEILETQWDMPNWKEQNEIWRETDSASSKSVDSLTGDKPVPFFVYREIIIKKCLKSWNLTINKEPVPVSSENIDKLPGHVVIALFDKFNGFTEFSEEELGN
jgi:hypothetical protein